MPKDDTKKEPKRYVLEAEPGHIGLTMPKAETVTPVGAPAIVRMLPVECHSCGAKDKFIVGVQPTGETAEIRRIECGACGYGWGVADGYIIARHGKVNHRHKKDWN